MKHLFDHTRGGTFACDAPERGNGEMLEKFEALSPADRCGTCAAQIDEIKKYERTCRICKSEFPAPTARADHELSHLLTCESYRGDPLAFALRAQGYYDQTSRKARSLARAMSELDAQQPGVLFTVIPSRLMLTRDGENGVLHGQAHVVDFIFVQT